MTYIPGSIPPNEEARLGALRACDVLDTAPEAAFDDLVELASELCGTPIALVSLVDRDRQWFKARVGLAPEQTPRDVSFCGHVVGEDKALLVSDTQLDARFAGNPLVTEDPHIRFYAGCPLRSEAGHVLGTLCVIDRKPNTLSEGQQRKLEILAKQVSDQLQMRKLVHEVERKNIRLRRTCEELEQYAHVISHDLKEPVRTIRSYVQMYREDFGKELGETEQRYLDFIQNGSDRMHGMIRDLFEFARAGGEGLAFESVSLTDLVQGVVESLAPQLEETGAVVEVAPLPTVHGLPAQLHQVFQNVISNGVKFCTESPPRIVISSREEPAHWDVSVQDNGIGIHHRDFPRVFQVFQRLHHSSEYEGSGIGLAVAKKVMEAHGGAIAIDSQVGAGSTFCLRFPRAFVGPAVSG